MKLKTSVERIANRKTRPQNRRAQGAYCPTDGGADARKSKHNLGPENCQAREQSLRRLGRQRRFVRGADVKKSNTQRRYKAQCH